MKCQVQEEYISTLQTSLVKSLFTDTVKLKFAIFAFFIEDVKIPIL